MTKHRTYYTFMNKTGERQRADHRDEIPEYVEKYWIHEPAVRDYVSGELAHQNCPRCQPKGQLIDQRKTS